MAKKYRLVKTPDSWPWSYVIRELSPFGSWNYVSGSLAMTKWGAKRNLKKILARKGNVVIEEFEL